MDTGKRVSIKTSSGGFTIIELAIAILVISGLVTTAVKLIKTWTDQDTQVKNRERLTVIQDALDTYAKKYNRLPCAARFTAPMGTANFGRERSPCAGGGGTFSVAGRTGTTDPYGTGPVQASTIIIGALPVRDLGLPDSYALNDNGYTYTYAVTNTYAAGTRSITLGPINPYAGAIRVVDQNLNSVLPPPTNGAAAPNNGTALYVVADHGRDGKGAYRSTGAPSPLACNGTAGLDNNNCNQYASGYFRSAPASTSTGANWFDDMLVYGTALSMSPACVTVFGNSLTAGTSPGHNQAGVDAGVGAGVNFWLFFVEFFTFWYANWMTINVNAPPAAPSPFAGAYCPNESYHVVSGGCTMTMGNPVNSSAAVANGVNGLVTNVYGADIFMGATQWTMYGNYHYYQWVMPPLSHPTPTNSLGLQGWECNGSSAQGMRTQAYAVCCPG